MESLPGRETIILTVIACAAFMATLDSTIVNISLPTISDSFSVDMGTVSWVVMAYLLALSGFMLSFGRLGDIVGFRRVFIAGFGLFTFSSLFCGLSGSISELIFFRILQGVGAAAGQSISAAMIALYLPENKRGWAFGILMTLISLGIAGGPVLGGYITEYLGWHWIFFINVPMGIFGICLALRYLPVDSIKPKKMTFDTVGAVLILIALTTLLFPLNQGLYMGWRSPVVIGSFIVSVVVWTIFIFYEKGFRTPLIDMSLFTSQNYRYGNIAGMLLILSFAGTEFLLPFYFETVHGYSTEIAGMFLAIPAVFLMVAGPVAGKITDKYGSRSLMIGSALLASVAMLLYSLFSATTSEYVIIITLAIEGCAVGLFMPPNMSLITCSGVKEKEGVSSGIMMTLRNAGGVLGIALFGTIAMQSILNEVGGAYSDLNAEQAMAGFHIAFLGGVIVCIVVAAFSWFVSEPNLSTRILEKND